MLITWWAIYIVAKAIVVLKYITDAIQENSELVIEYSKTERRVVALPSGSPLREVFWPYMWRWGGGGGKDVSFISLFWEVVCAGNVVADGSKWFVVYARQWGVEENWRRVGEEEGTENDQEREEGASGCSAGCPLCYTCQVLCSTAGVVAESVLFVLLNGCDSAFYNCFAHEIVSVMKLISFITILTSISFNKPDSKFLLHKFYDVSRKAAIFRVISSSILFHVNIVVVS